MATVNGLTSERMRAIEAECIIGGSINESGHLLLTRHDGGTVDAGAIFGELPNASTTVIGVTQLASTGETATGTNAVKVVTPAALHPIVVSLTDGIAGSQPLDSDLTAIAGLTAAANDIIQRKAGAWVNRTPVQYLADLVAIGAQTNEIYNGSEYGLAGGAITYIGDTDPGGTAANGSVWFDTSGS